MCSKTTLRNRSKRRKSNPKPLRRAKTKTRSLQKDFSPTTPAPESTDSTTHQPPQTDHLLLEEKENVAYLLDDTDTSATLNGLIWSSTSGGGVVSSEEDSLRPYTYHEDGTTTTTATNTTTTSSLLERSALRGAGNSDLREEKWVCYEEVTSCVPETKNNGLRLSLKLDYDEIMNAWSDKGPLYVDHAIPVVPDVLQDDDALQKDITNAFLGVGNVPRLRLPDDGSSVMGGEKAWKLGPREAGVLRYKKKRQNRLFSKRIRYEVRKLNAEKRPRMKGRFVKRS